MPNLSVLPTLLYIAFFVLAIFYVLLPFFIYWRCGDILRRIKRLEDRL
jgi:hypothetical protein